MLHVQDLFLMSADMTERSSNESIFLYNKVKTISTNKNETNG